MTSNRVGSEDSAAKSDFRVAKRKLAHRCLMALHSRASTVSRVSDQAPSADEVIPLVQFGPTLSSSHCAYDEYPLDEYTTVHIQKDFCLFLDLDGSVTFEVHTTTYRFFTMFG